MNQQYKSPSIFCFEEGFDTTFNAVLYGHVQNPIWEFTLWSHALQEAQILWRGTLQELAEIILLGTSFKFQLKQEALKLENKGEEKVCRDY